jgi:hypothetical protein
LRRGADDQPSPALPANPPAAKGAALGSSTHQPQGEPSSEAPKKPKREHLQFDVEHYIEQMRQLQAMNAAERRDFRKKSRMELFVTDLRDEVVGIVHARFGRGSDAFLELEDRGGPVHQTLHNWDSGVTLQPRLETMRRALVICGKDFGIIDRR